MYCTAINKSLFTIPISEMAERVSGPYWKEDDCLNTKPIQREKQFGKVQKKIYARQQWRKQGYSATGELLLPWRLRSSASQADGQMVKNKAASFLPLLSLEFYYEAVLCLSPRRQEEAFLSPTLQSHSAFFNGASGDYCNDSGMVLTTWAASVAAGGEPKKVLV